MLVIVLWRLVAVEQLAGAPELGMAPALEALVGDKVPLTLLLEPVVKGASLGLRCGARGVTVIAQKHGFGALGEVGRVHGH